MCKTTPILPIPCTRLSNTRSSWSPTRAARVIPCRCSGTNRTVRLVPEQRHGITRAALVGDQELRVFESRVHGIGSIGVVLHIELFTQRHYGLGHHLAEALVEGVDEVHAPIGH